MSNDQRLIELAVKVADVTSAEAVEISKVLTKLKKLAKTIGNRQARLRNYVISRPDISPEAFDAKTQKFFDKAYKLAHSIGCEFVEAQDGPDRSGRFYLRVNGTLERII